MTDSDRVLVPGAKLGKMNITPARPAYVCAVDAHCWHDAGRMLLTLPPVILEFCCWCNVVRERPRSPSPDMTGHGPHAP